MLAVLAVSVSAALGALAGCSLITTPGTSPGPGAGPGPAPAAGLLAADVVIVDDPVDGGGATELTCSFEATQLGTDGIDPVQIRVDWSASCGTHKTETFIFRGGDEVFTSTYEDPAGMTFWATLRWTDGRGSHVLRSAPSA